MPYMVTFTINIPQMLVYMPYMDPMGDVTGSSYMLWQCYGQPFRAGLVNPDETGSITTGWGPHSVNRCLISVAKNGRYNYSIYGGYIGL